MSTTIQAMGGLGSYSTMLCHAISASRHATITCEHCIRNNNDDNKLLNLKKIMRMLCYHCQKASILKHVVQCKVQMQNLFQRNFRIKLDRESFLPQFTTRLSTMLSSSNESKSSVSTLSKNTQRMLKQIVCTCSIVAPVIKMKNYQQNVKLD